MRVLFIAYYFPPLGGAGVQRSLKYVKYLPNFGITPVVISADEHGYIKDTSLMSELSAKIKVCRVEFVPLVEKIKLVIRRQKKHGVLSGAVKAGKGRSLRNTFLKLYATFQFPDDKHSWSDEVYKIAAGLIERGEVDLIYSTSPPVSAHFVAKKLKERFGLPWVADFRDQWTGNPNYDVFSCRKLIDRRLESSLLCAADAVIGAHREMLGKFGRICGGDKVHFLPNGYDEDDFRGANVEVLRDGRFTMLHAGSLYGNRSPQGILDGVDLFLTRRPDLVGKFCLRFLGNIGSRFDESISRFSDKYPGVLELESYVPHSEVPSHLLNSNALLLLIGGGDESKGWIVGKIFEYIRACRPILALTPPDSDAAKLIEEVGWGVAIREDRVDLIADTLEKWVSGDIPCGVSPEDERVTQYERRVLTERLSEIMRAVIEKNAAKCLAFR